MTIGSLLGSVIHVPNPRTRNLYRTRLDLQIKIILLHDPRPKRGTGIHVRCREILLIFLKKNLIVNNILIIFNINFHDKS